MLMFRLKETLPIKKKVFWSDLKVTRRIYQRRALLQVVEVDPNDSKDDDHDDLGPTASQLHGEMNDGSDDEEEEEGRLWRQ